MRERMTSTEVGLKMIKNMSSCRVGFVREWSLTVKQCSEKPSQCTAFSVDVVDLLYSIPHATLLTCVKACITDHNDEFAFVNRCGISVENFIELLSFYLSSTLVRWDAKVFTQKSGICIGSRVAPVLSDIFLSCVDRVLHTDFGEMVLKVFRYVDDYMILLRRKDYLRQMIDILKCFRERGQGLQFTSACPVNGALQFLDFSLSFHDSRVCWAFAPRSRKPLLSFFSCHSKIVKSGIAVNILFSALTKSCEHMLASSFQCQVERLRNAGFPDDALVSALQKVIRKLKIKGKPQNDKEKDSKRKKLVVIPYIHGISHCIKEDC